MKRYLILVTIVLVFCGVSMAQTTEFTYQGSLKNGAVPATGNHDFEFLLFDAVSGGTQIGTTIPQNSVPVADGTFTVKLNFGASFPGANRFLEIHVRQTGGGGFTPLAPRQAVTSSPYAVQTIRAASAAVADTVQAGNITGVLHPSQGGTGIGPAFPVANTFLRSNGAGWTASGIFPTDIPGGNTNYIQNATTQQTTSNFNVSGTGTALSFNAATQYNIGGNRVLSNSGTNNLFAGINAGASNTGVSNSFFGYTAGQVNTSGSGNSFFGAGAGQANISGNSNSFFGVGAGGNTTGNSNSFFGLGAGGANTTGINNSFVGTSAGVGNTSGSNNTIIGTFADVTTGNLSNATAIGGGALVSQSNSLVLGNGVNVGIGTSAPQYAVHVVGENVRVEGNSPSIFPRFSINFTDGAVDGKRWQNYASLNALNFTALNDAENAETFWLQVNRGTGTAISSVVFPNGNVVINNLGAAGNTSLCRNALNQISTCTAGNLTEQEKQITKQQTNIDAQQKQIDEQNQLINLQKEKLEIAERQMKQQRSELEALKTLVCSQNPTAELCSSELRLQP